MRRDRSAKTNRSALLGPARTIALIASSCAVSVFGVYSALGPDRDEALAHRGEDMARLTEETAAAVEGRLTRGRIIVDLAANDADLLDATDRLQRDGSDAAVDHALVSLAHLQTFFDGGTGEIELVTEAGRELAVLVESEEGEVDSAELGTDDGEDFLTSAFDIGIGEVFQSEPYLSEDTERWVVSLATPIDTAGEGVVLHVEVPLGNLTTLLEVDGVRSTLLTSTDGQVLFDNSGTAARDILNAGPISPTAPQDSGWTSRDWIVSGYEFINAQPGSAPWALVLTDTDAVGLLEAADAGTAVLVALGAAGMAAVLFSLREARRRHDDAKTDPLTGLGNRRQLEESFAQSGGAQPERTLVAMLDLNGFKEINDTFGHAVGDKVLQSVASRLKSALSGHAVVTRTGGDEFVVVSKGVWPSDAQALAQRMVDALDADHDLGQRVLLVPGAIGLAASPDHGTDLDEVLRRADSAMYHAKRRGGGFALFEPGLGHIQTRRLEVAAKLRVAIGLGSVEVHYQPVVTAAGELHGVEALLRWPESNLGPLDIVEAAEAGGLMRMLTDYIVDRAIRQSSIWQDSGLSLVTAINLSASNLLEDDLAERIEIATAIHGVDPRRLAFEITESVMLRDRSIAEEVTRRLTRLGASVGIDDYGTANAGIGYLKGLSARFVKIDRSFTSTVTDSPADAAIIASTVTLAHSLGMQVIAEGVENEATAARLIELGCDLLQGYHFGRPAPAESCLNHLIRR